MTSMRWGERLRRKENKRVSNKKKKSMYEEMVEDLAVFVMRTATKDNPSPKELSAMVDISKMLFRTT